MIKKETQLAMLSYIKEGAKLNIEHTRNYLVASFALLAVWGNLYLDGNKYNLSLYVGIFFLISIIANLISEKQKLKTIEYIEKYNVPGPLNNGIGVYELAVTIEPRIRLTDFSYKILVLMFYMALFELFFSLVLSANLINYCRVISILVIIFSFYCKLSATVCDLNPSL